MYRGNIIVHQNLPNVGSELFNFTPEETVKRAYKIQIIPTKPLRNDRDCTFGVGHTHNPLTVPSQSL